MRTINIFYVTLHLKSFVMQVGRVEQVDFIRCVCIVLMVLIHIVYWGNMYQYPKAIILTFIMPVFLFISGYFMNADKPVRGFIHQMRCLLVPYLIMETGYVLIASVLPIREHIQQLTPTVFAGKLLLNPLGPYWFLHTLIICSVVYYVVNRIGSRMNTVTFVAVLSLVMWLVCEVLHLVAIGYVAYFIAGLTIKRCGKDILDIFQPSFFTVIPFFIICMYPDSMNCGAPVGIILCYIVVCLLLAVHNVLPEVIKTPIYFIGRNTLPVLLFSPMFTVLTKSFVSLFAFEPTATLYAILSVAFSASGSFGVAWLMDKLRLSPLFYGKRKMLF